jgi:hypothetical protein
MGGFKKGKIAGTAVVSAYCKSLKLPEKLPKWQAVALKKCQLARHKESRFKDQEIVSQCLWFANITIRQCKHGCKKEDKRKEKRQK